MSGAPKGDQGSFGEVPKSPTVKIHPACRAVMSCQGAARSPQRGPNELLESQNWFQSSPEELHRGSEELRKFLKVKDVIINKVVERSRNIIVFLEV